MARYTDPVCKRCRREGKKLFLKAGRCYTNKCPIEKEAAPPGMHGTRKSKQSEYGVRLREKQRLKWFYGILERQFRRYFTLAARSASNTGEQLLIILERRLDNCVHRMGMATSRNAARQLINHGHLLLNGVKCNIPSVLVKPGDLITVKARPNSQALVRIMTADNSSKEPCPDFLELIPGDVPEGRVSRMPARSDVDPRIGFIREQLIIEIVTR